jgi:NitT/TauT family transport system substrate-binding protein
MVSHLVSVDGGDPAKVQTVDSDHNELTPAYLRAAEIDALFGGYWCWDVLSDTPDDDLITWRVDEIGAPAYHSYLLGTQQWTIESAPELVRLFLDATARGFQTAAADQREAVALLHRAIPYVPAWRLARSLELVSLSWFHQGAWGVQREPELVAGYAEWLASYGVLSSPDAWQGATTNDYLPIGADVARV